MGVVNITPDSFSDGGRTFDPEAALRRAEELVADGAAIIDCGAVSSRPGAAPVSVAEERRRLEPFLKGWNKRQLPALLSVDTCSPEVMRLAADSGAGMINDIQGLADQATLQTLATYGLHYVAMHMHGTPQTMQQAPLSASEAVERVTHFFELARARLSAAGFSADRIWLDPGIGFGKSDEANWKLVNESRRLARTMRLVVGISRKSFLGRFFGLESPLERDAPSKMLELGLLWSGVQAIRTHDVAGLARLRTLATPAGD